MSDLTQFDHYLSRSGPAALVIRESLIPVEGADGVIFPPTYAAGENKADFSGGYNVDTGTDGKNVCLVDSVGSQANRIEPLFKEAPYRALVPQIVVQAGEKSVNLLDAGHRAGDALVRCSALQEELQNAFKAVLKGDCTPMARIAPTSLVFGVWDSRDTQAKVPRVLISTIRAYNVRRLTRSAQYVSTTRYLDPEAVAELKGAAPEKELSVRGFLDVPATGSHGGVIAEGGIRREAVLALAALRLLAAGSDEARTLALRRYILGLALTAFTGNSAGYLRQGCLLVLDPQPAKAREFDEVYPDGARKPCAVTHDAALAYAAAAAAAFGVGPDQTVPFDKERARKDVQGDGEGKKPKKEKAAK